MALPFYKTLENLAGKRPIILAMEPLDKTAENYHQRVKRVAFL